MKVFVAVLRISLIFLTTLIIYLVYLSGALFLVIRPDWRNNWRNHCLQIWAAAVSASLNLKIETDGPLPKPPFFLVTNHLSYLDIVVFYRLLDCTFISMKEVKSWPVIGWMARTLDVIFIDRGSRSDLQRVNRIISEKLAPSQGIVLFPEGGTSSGIEVRPFGSSLLEPLAVNRFGVSYAAISYGTHNGDPDASESVVWWGGVSLGSHFVKLASNRGVCCKVHFGSQPIYSDNRKELALRLHDKVSTLYQQVKIREES